MNERIKEDLFQSMKEDNKIKRNILQIIRANIINLSIEKKISENELQETDVLNIIVKEIKQQNESLHYAVKGNREDLVETINKNIEILYKYLPKQLTEDEVEIIIKEVLQELNIENPTNKDKGAIMKKLMPLTRGKVDGNVISTILNKFIK